MASKDSFVPTLHFESCLGLGGFGIVLKAVNPSSTPPEATAVKFIFPTESNATKEHIMRECTLAINFNHENLVKILEVSTNHFDASEIETIFHSLPEDDDDLQSFRVTCVDKAKRKKTIETISLQMQLCGKTLRNWLKLDHDPHSQETQSMQFQICKGLVRGLEYLHDNKIMHRDLKPENIMFSNSGFALPIKIGDFGLCRKLHSSETQTNPLTSRIGTYDYMAPEVYTKDYSFPADLYSLGLIIWEVVQLIKPGDRRNLFHRLVTEKEDNLVQNHPTIVDSRHAILYLTKKKIVDRTPSIKEVVWIFDSHSRHYVVYTTQELVDCLKTVGPGERIVLGQGVYEGQFELRADGVEIVGQGNDTVLKGGKNGRCLHIRGSGCSISRITIISLGERGVGIDLVGERNVVRNIKMSETRRCILVFGSDNRLEVLTLGRAFAGVQIYGSNNTLDQINLENIGHNGIDICTNSKRNTISNITGVNVKTGIHLQNSPSNIISNINLVKGGQGLKKFGIDIHSSPNTTISNLICSGYSREKEDWGLRINSTNCSLKDSQCGSVLVDGDSRTISLKDVDCGELIQIEKEASGVYLTNCSGQALSNHGYGLNVTTTNCHFP